MHRESTTLDELDDLNIPSAHRLYKSKAQPTQASEPTQVSESTQTSEPTQVSEPIAATPYSAARDMLSLNQDDYKSGSRNAISDIIAKPQRDTAKEERLKQVAKWSFISDAIGLIGKGYAASRGAKVEPTEGSATTNALNELRNLDDIYRQDGYRYDQNMLMGAVRQEDKERKDAVDAQQRADQANYVQQQRADRDNELKLKRENQLADAAAGIQETIRREKVAAQASVKDHENRMALQAADYQLQAQASKARKSSSGGGSGTDDVKPYTANVPMAYTDPKTGKVVNVTDGDFAVLLREARAWDSELDKTLVGLDYDGGDKEKLQRAARDGVASYLNNGDGQAFRQTVEALRERGINDLSMLKFINLTNGYFNAYDNNQLKSIFSKMGINLKLEGER